MKRIKIIALSRNILLMVFCFLLFQCTSIQGPKIVNAKDYNGTIDGKKVALYTLKNQKGMVMQVTNYGAKIVSLFVPDKNGVIVYPQNLFALYPPFPRYNTVFVAMSFAPQFANRWARVISPAKAPSH